MGNIFDYLNWRGDISFESVGVTEADYAVLAGLAYFPFDGIVPETFGDALALDEAVTRVDALIGTKGDGRSYHNKGDDRMAVTIPDCPRFADLNICGYVKKYNRDREEQFCAMTFILPKGDVVVAFRGTDDTIIGWKEDFNMGFMDDLPSQRDAVEYVTQVSETFNKRIYVCGHSKGGNLAMYGASFCEKAVQKRIKAVRNLDGPGFSEKVLEAEGVKRMLDRTKTFVPQESVVGMLLGHAEPYYVVHSNGVAIMQHLHYSWEIRRGEFVADDGLTESSQLIDATLKEWIRGMDMEQRSRLVDGFFAVIMASDATTLAELATGKSTLAMLKALNRIDDETKEIFSSAYKIFKKSLKKTLPIVKTLRAQKQEQKLNRPENGE